MLKIPPSEFKILYEEYNSLVRSVIYQIAGPKYLNDLVQEAFIKIWKGLPGFNEHSKMSSWIYRIATNIAIDSRRAATRRHEEFGYDFGQIRDPRAGADKELENRQLVQQGLESLSDDHRVVLVLAYIHERPLSEIAENLGLSEGTVKSRLHYAKTAFAEYLKSKGAVA
ncbi:MAG: hypothetical protein A2622_04100 [Bdellovibrionales bacterium RIFCSPHIGHO2_01_FULL_40_29]|nr:MAG: hypothetical protein A2622_04100 [Bdellovibrionales bacterium RIFCSPHIGHO2_01_FULL_40_29]OFZ34879.1 MAG: hypothetical protein A3D17_11275 [Bdellovibrionales bacterium RIFCSPHIGHO2_02_FULL_40_15]